MNNTGGRKMHITQFFGRKNTSPRLLSLYERFGYRGHNGWDVRAHYVNTYAPCDGQVIGWIDEKDNRMAKGDFLNMVT